MRVGTGTGEVTVSSLNMSVCMYAGNVAAGDSMDESLAHLPGLASLELLRQMLQCPNECNTSREG